MNWSVGSTKFEQLGIDERAGVDDDVGSLEQALALDRDELGIAGAGADYMNQLNHSLSFD